MINVLAPNLPARVEDDRQAWRAFRYHSRTFSLAARLLPRPVQMPVATLYLFCRRVDSIADRRVLTIGADAALRETEALRRKLDATLTGAPPDGYLWKRLFDVHERYALSPAPLYELLDGARWDLRGRSIHTRDDLIRYSNLVGGSVGAMMLPFLLEGAPPNHLDAPARALGIGMQITNILRDVGEDYRHLERIYLPQEAMARHGVSPEDLTRDQPSDNYVDLLEELMIVAESYYEAAEPGLQALPGRVRTGIRAAARMYQEILNQIRSAGYDNLAYRAYVPFWKKGMLIVRDGYATRREKLRQPEHPLAAWNPLSAVVPE